MTDDEREGVALCPECDGAGSDDDARTCQRCEGNGEIVVDWACAALSPIPATGKPE